MKIAWIIGGVVGALIALAWLGLRIGPGSFSAYSIPAGPVEYIPLPTGLPAPVERFYRELYGDRIPVIGTAVISGKASLKVNGITFPGRFRFTHQTGKSYRHYIEATIFGLPLMRVNERYIDGVSRMALPFGTTENEPQINQAANLALWAEAMWFPGILVTDPSLRWESLDDHSAVLAVPFGDQEELFIARFDPETALLTTLESMRYKDEKSRSKSLWITRALEWQEVDGYLIPRTSDATWFDEGGPWAVFAVDELVINSDVDNYLRSEGP